MLSGTQTSKRLVEYGSYPNVSKIVRVEVAAAVEASQINPELLPFGVYGPTKLEDFHSHESDDDNWT